MKKRRQWPRFEPRYRKHRPPTDYTAKVAQFRLDHPKLVPPGQITRVTVVHEDHCPVLKGKPVCRCDCYIKPGMPEP